MEEIIERDGRRFERTGERKIPREGEWFLGERGVSDRVQIKPPFPIQARKGWPEGERELLRQIFSTLPVAPSIETGFEVLIKFHNTDAEKFLKPMDKIRELIATALEETGAKEDVEFTVEVSRTRKNS